MALERKPAALDHAPVYRDWQLPPAFGELRRALEEQGGRRTGTRHFIRVLQLLARHPIARVEEAITQCRGRGALDAAAVIAQVERRAAGDTPVLLPPLDLPALIVPPPDLSQFNRLLSHNLRGEEGHDCTEYAAAEGQSEAVEAANYVGRT